MANPAPLPPIVNGPIYTTSTRVYVDNVLPNSIVTVYHDKDGTHQPGTAKTSSWITSRRPVIQNRADRLG